MIVPLVAEPEWMRSLDGLPAFQPGPQPVLLIAPHPDDETLGAGGLIAALSRLGVDITVVAVTDGERAYFDCDEVDPGELASLRCGEQTAALARLGVASQQIVRLHLPDSNVAAHERDLVDCLVRLATPQTHIIAPWRGDFHPDHEACGRAAEAAAHELGARLSSYLFWTWHRGHPALLEALPLRSFALGEEDVQAKIDALNQHRSQLAHPLQPCVSDSQPDLAILPPYLLGPARRSFEVFFAS